MVISKRKEKGRCFPHLSFENLSFKENPSPPSLTNTLLCLACFKSLLVLRLCPEKSPNARESKM